ncbi:MAG: hypothetical protein U9P72_09440 [Campylobacterota bacterium]|nr:hypothetical protein [Campylobacterota bacterium]
MEYIFNAHGKKLKANIIKNNQEYIFNILVSVLDKGKYKYIITMSDTTAIEQENILLEKL